MDVNLENYLYIAILTYIKLFLRFSSYQIDFI